jgi:hypothetical protein
VAATLDRHRG